MSEPPVLLPLSTPIPGSTQSSAPSGSTTPYGEVDEDGIPIDIHQINKMIIDEVNFMMKKYQKTQRMLERTGIPALRKEVGIHESNVKMLLRKRGSESVTIRQYGIKICRERRNFSKTISAAHLRRVLTELNYGKEEHNKIINRILEMKAQDHEKRYESLKDKNETHKMETIKIDMTERRIAQDAASATPEQRAEVIALGVNNRSGGGRGSGRGGSRRGGGGGKAPVRKSNIVSFSAAMREVMKTSVPPQPKKTQSAFSSSAANPPHIGGSMETISPM